MSKKLVSNRPQDMVDIKSIIPNISVKLPYATIHNFTGQIIPGYKESIAYLTKDAIHSLKVVQDILNKKKLSLHIFDAYRPNKSVQYFCNNWSKSDDNLSLKNMYYPNKTKEQVIQEGFIAKESSHSYGSTIDLSIVDLNTNLLIDMGGEFDLFDEISFTNSNKISDSQKKNRVLLKSLMELNGFVNYNKEWWHYRFIDGPYYQKIIFDFDIV